jgi:hypothetical protein
VAKAQPQARDVKVCHDGTVKRPCKRGIITVPKDECTKVSTAISSSKRVYPNQMTHLTGVEVAVALAYVEHPHG